MLSRHSAGPRARHRALSGRAFLTLVGIAVGAAGTGCDLDDLDHDVVVPRDTTPPAVPTSVRSITGDGQVELVWNPNGDADLAGYRIYWSPAAAGPYEFMAETGVPRYTDRDVANGETYFYAVTAFDLIGNESELSAEFVHDTPRPAGQDLVLWRATGSSWELSGYDFSAMVRRPFTAVDTDMYFTFDAGRPAMVAPDPATDLQDAGYAELDDLDWAPPGGWTGEDRVTLIAGHSYYVWTRDDHYAKFRVTDLDAERVVVDWAYQIDKSNPELVGGR